MSLDVLLQGRLVKTPEQRTAKNGSVFATAQFVVAVDGDDTVLVSAIVFRKDVVTALQALDAGDSVCVAGRAKLSAWSDRQSGEPRAGLSVVAEQVLTSYHVRRKHNAMQGDGDADDAPQGQAAERRATRPDSSRSGVPARDPMSQTAGGIAELVDDDPFSRS